MLKTDKIGKFIDMVDSPETKSGSNQDKAQEARQKAAEEFKKIQTAQEKKEAVDRILRAFENEQTRAGEVAHQVRQSGGLVPAEKKEDAVRARTSLAQVFELVKQAGQNNIPPEALGRIPEKSLALLQKIDERVGGERLSDASAAIIFPFVQKLLNRELSGQEIVNEFDRLRQTLSFSPDVLRQIAEAVQDTAREGKLDLVPENIPEKSGSPENAEGRPATPESLEERVVRGRYDNFDSFWGQFGAYFSPEEDKEVIRAVIERENFADFVKTRKQAIEEEMRTEKPTVTSQEINVRFSRELRDSIVRIFSKIYSKLDLEKATEYFDHIIQEDFYQGIMPAAAAFKRNLIALSRYCEQHHEDFEGLEMFQEIEGEAKLEERDIERKDKSIARKAYVRLNPLRVPKKVHMNEFIHYVDTMMDHYITARQYTHNVRASFFKPAGEKGFYGGIAGYSESWPMIELDEMFLLPDSDVMVTAMQIYDKYVEEAFAARDWKHSPAQFTPQIGSLYTEIEADTLEALKMMYGKSKSEEQLRAALSMAIGAARGIFLNEVEKAAFADPHLTPEGKYTFTSYYTNDNAALTPLNPHHLIWRFQQESQINPILFLPLEGLDNIGRGPWDHGMLFKKQAEFRKTFLEGRAPLGKQKLFMDLLVNIGDIGGILKRKGWRTENQLESLFVYEKKVDEKTGRETRGSLNNLATWRALENIGFEAVYDFILNDRYDKKAEVNEFFSYLFQQYFNQPSEGFSEYYKALKQEIRESVINQIRKKKISPESIDEAIEEEAKKTFLFRTLSRVIARRIPSKFVRIDRDRFSAEGVSRWKKICEEMGLSFQDFDRVMKDLLLAENLLRKEVSDKMREQSRQGKKMHEMTGLDYNLTESRIRTLLGAVRETSGQKIKAERINSVVRLFHLIQANYSGQTEEAQQYLNEFGKLLANKGIDREFKFTLAFDDMDVSFIPFRGAGPRVVPRALSEIGVMEQKVINPLLTFHNVLHQISIDGKHDFSEIIKIIKTAKEALQGAIGLEYGQQVAYYLAAAAISYFKKDTVAKALFGAFTMERLNSMAAEVAGRNATVWEWEARDIDRFCLTLETQNILKRNPYDLAVPNSEATYEPVWISLFGKPIKLPLKRRKRDFRINSRMLRDKFGGGVKHIIFDIINKYLPLAALFILWKLINDAIKENEKKK